MGNCQVGYNLVKLGQYCNCLEDWTRFKVQNSQNSQEVNTFHSEIDLINDSKILQQAFEAQDLEQNLNIQMENARKNQKKLRRRHKKKEKQRESRAKNKLQEIKKVNQRIKIKTNQSDKKQVQKALQKSMSTEVEESIERIKVKPTKSNLDSLKGQTVVNTKNQSNQKQYKQKVIFQDIHDETQIPSNVNFKKHSHPYLGKNKSHRLQIKHQKHNSEQNIGLDVIDLQKINSNSITQEVAVLADIKLKEVKHSSTVPLNSYSYTSRPQKSQNYLSYWHDQEEDSNDFPFQDQTFLSPKRKSSKLTGQKKLIFQECQDQNQRSFSQLDSIRLDKNRKQNQGDEYFLDEGDREQYMKENFN